MSRPSVHEPLYALALAVVAQAVKDARSGQRDARAWLKSTDAEVYLNVIGYEPGVVIRWMQGLEESEMIKPGASMGNMSYIARTRSEKPS